jgi:S1-C subfamily serine protease
LAGAPALPKCREQLEEAWVRSPFEGLEVGEPMRPSPIRFGFDLEQALSSVVALEAAVPEDAFTASILGTERLGNGVVINANGLVATIGYLITEAEEVFLTTNAGRRVPAHVLGYDHATGFGLVQALEPLDVPALPLGDSRRLRPDDPVILAGAGGRSHAVSAHVVARETFAGYWEYLLDEALFTGPAHPHWSGGALIGPSGELVGMGSLHLEQETPDGEITPLNMCVPAELLAPILDDLARGRLASPPRPWLGIFAQEIEGKVVVLGVAKGGPAARAELRRGDVVLAIAGTPVEDLPDLYQRLWALGAPGVEAPLTLWRGGDTFEVEVRTVDRAALLRKPRFN